MTWIRKSYNLYEKENTAMFVLGIHTVRFAFLHTTKDDSSCGITLTSDVKRSNDGSFTTCADEFRLMGEYVDGATTCGDANEGASKYGENYGYATNEELCEREEEH
ncbi:hypothetical protein RIF29_39602 [Crotalaria pallida]|uniref:Uncharacterized protein n=1 Tax=Crotalaria pallida TaxID=3830 RepID=A0AAN9E2C0_CROPI